MRTAPESCLQHDEMKGGNCKIDFNVFCQFSTIAEKDGLKTFLI